MSKFTPKELKQSLLNGLTLMESKDRTKTAWVEYHEIDLYIKAGFVIFNEEKSELYRNVNRV